MHARIPARQAGFCYHSGFGTGKKPALRNVAAAICPYMFGRVLPGADGRPEARQEKL